MNGYSLWVGFGASLRRSVPDRQTINRLNADLAVLGAVSLINPSPAPTWNGPRIDSLSDMALLVVLLIIVLNTALAARFSRTQTAANFEYLRTITIHGEIGTL